MASPPDPTRGHCEGREMNAAGQGPGRRPAEAEGADTRGLDLSEKGTRDGERISLNRRLFVKFTAYGGLR